MAGANAPDWIVANADLYRTQVEEPLRRLAEQLNQRIATFAPEFITPPEQAVMPPRRVRRAGHPVPPLRADAGLRFRRREQGRAVGAGFTLQIAPQGIAMFGGIFRPQPDELEAIRHWLLERHAVVAEVLRSASPRLAGVLQDGGERDAPSGWDASHPAADLLGRRAFYMMRCVPVSFLGRQSFVRDVGASFRAMTPFVRCLNDAMLGRSATVGSIAPAWRSEDGTSEDGGWRGAVNA